jgi:membrane-associated PAP2 superfamily phosphatase
MTPTIEAMKSELLSAGWIEKQSTVWQAPWCAYYRGPAGAYRVMKTETEARKDNAPWPPKHARPGYVWGAYKLDKDGWWRLNSKGVTP